MRVKVPKETKEVSKQLFTSDAKKDIFDFEGSESSKFYQGEDVDEDIKNDSFSSLDDQDLFT